jgi:hypothetical protein
MNTPRFTLVVDGLPMPLDRAESEAMADAKDYFEARSTPVTVALMKNDSELLRWHTNRRITGIFRKQVWGGRKGDDAIYAGDAAFDATSAVLQLDLDAIRELEDNSENSDAIGRSLVEWHGPCDVSISDSMLAFFGVRDSEDITDKHLELARAAFPPQPRETQLDAAPSTDTSQGGNAALSILNARKAAALDQLIQDLTDMGFGKNEPINGGDCVETVDQIYSRLVKAFGAPSSSNDSLFRVHVFYDNPTTRESRLLGEWTGHAPSKHEARMRAHDELWDARLVAAGCTPSYDVEELDDEDEDNEREHETAAPRVAG